MSLPVAPTMFLLVSPLSTTPAITVELIMILGLLCIFRPLLPSPCDSYLPLRLPFPPALGDGSHVHRNWTRHHRVTIVVHGLTQFLPVGFLSTLDKQVHPDGLWRILDHDGTQKVL